MSSSPQRIVPIYFQQLEVHSLPTKRTGQWNPPSDSAERSLLYPQLFGGILSRFSHCFCRVPFYEDIETVLTLFFPISFPRKQAGCVHGCIWCMHLGGWNAKPGCRCAMKPNAYNKHDEFGKCTCSSENKKWGTDTQHSNYLPAQLLFYHTTDINGYGETTNRFATRFLICALKDDSPMLYFPGAAVHCWCPWLFSWKADPCLCRCILGHISICREAGWHFKFLFLSQLASQWQVGLLSVKQ